MVCLARRLLRLDAGIVPPVVSYFALEEEMGFAVPLLIATWIGSLGVIAALLVSPKPKAKRWPST